MSGATVAERMEGHRRIRIAIAAGLGSGLILAAAAPAGPSGWLAWVALAPAAGVALAWRGTRAGRLAVPIAYGVYLEVLLIRALPFGIATGQWGDPPPVMVGDSPVLFVALLAVPAFAALLYLVRFGEPWGVDRLPASIRPIAAVVIPASAFAALDFVRVHLDPGGLWGPLFLSQHETGAAALATLGGPWLLSFAIAASGYAIGQLGVAALGRRPIRRPIAVALASGALIGAGVAIGGSLERGGGAPVEVAAVQPGYDTAEEDRPQNRYFEPGTHDLAALDLIRDLSPMTRAAVESGAEIVVWPEAAVFVDPAAEPAVGAALRRLARESGATIVLPYFVRGPDHGAALGILADGTFTAVQPKQRPMWFLGENGDNRVSPEPVPTGAARVGTLLGVDNQEPGVARALAERGAELLASATHDWQELAPAQRAFAALNAAATGTPVVRADWRYGSAIYGADGERIASAGGGLERTVVVASVSLGKANTPYEAIGDLVGWLFLALSCATAVFALAAGYRWSHEPSVAPR
jgi:apolipoprotein N-acyltransferase